MPQREAERPDMNLSDLLEDWRRKRDALELVAASVEAIRDPPETLKAIGIVARKALRRRPGDGG